MTSNGKNAVYKEENREKSERIELSLGTVSIDKWKSVFRNYLLTFCFSFMPQVVPARKRRYCPISLVWFLDGLEMLCLGKMVTGLRVRTFKLFLVAQKGLWVVAYNQAVFTEKETLKS